MIALTVRAAVEVGRGNYQRAIRNHTTEKMLRTPSLSPTPRKLSRGRDGQGEVPVVCV